VLFENLGEESIGGYKSDIGQIHNKSELADLLCSRLGRDVFGAETKERKQLGELLSDITSDKELSELGRRFCQR